MVDCTFTIEEMSTYVGPKFSQNIQTNPWFQNIKQFLNNHKKPSMCIFTPNVIQHIIDKQATHDTTFTNMDVPESTYTLTLLFDVCFEIRTNENKYYYIISHLEQQENDNIPQTYEAMTVKETTLNMKKNGFYLEMALILFLFPHGHSAYNGKTHFNEYLKYKMNALFSPFTLYKPYLSYMYDLQ
jgi:hypothetical protein